MPHPFIIPAMSPFKLYQVFHVYNRSRQKIQMFAIGIVLVDWDRLEFWLIPRQRVIRLHQTIFTSRDLLTEKTTTSWRSFVDSTTAILTPDPGNIASTSIRLKPLKKKVENFSAAYRRMVNSTSSRALSNQQDPRLQLHWDILPLFDHRQVKMDHSACRGFLQCEYFLCINFRRLLLPHTWNS